MSDTFHYDVRTRLFELISSIEDKEGFYADEYLQGMVAGLYKAQNILNNPKKENKKV